MTERETNLRSVLFLVIGILLLLSLVICIYIIGGEQDLVKTEADVIDVNKDADGTGKNDVTVVYDVDGVEYEYNFMYKDDINKDDKISIYYHKKNKTAVQTFKTSKLIFVCPLIGLALCIIGLVELFKKNNDGEDEFKTSVIGVVGNTQQLKIVTNNDTPVKEYEKSAEEKVETQVKTIKKEVVEPVVQEAVAPVAPVAPVVPVAPAPAPVKKVASSVAEIPPKMVAPESVVEPSELPAVKEEKTPVPIVQPKVVPKAPEASVASVKPVTPKPVQTSTSVENAIFKKVQNSMATSDSKAKVEINEDDIKQVIKDVLKEVIQEVKEEKEEPKVIEQKRVLPNYYYISGTSLIYEEPGKEAKEISLKTVKNVVRTVNSEGNVVKLVVSNEEVKCILTNMKNIDLEQVANLLYNKMRTIDENFKEEVEHKEY